MAKKDIIVTTKFSRWHIPKGHDVVIKEFEAGEELEIGKDVPASIAAEMVLHGYAKDPAAEAKEKAEAKAKADAEAEAKKKKDPKHPADENKDGKGGDESK